MQGQYPLLLNPYDVTHEIRDLGKAGARDFSAQIGEVQQALDAQATVYRDRIDLDASLMNQVAVELETAATC